MILSFYGEINVHLASIFNRTAEMLFIRLRKELFFYWDTSVDCEFDDWDLTGRYKFIFCYPFYLFEKLVQVFKGIKVLQGRIFVM